MVVPKPLIGQTASEFLRLYPSANILVATERDFEKSRRKQFVSRIATGDYDCIIMSHSQFEKIPISAERKERMLNEQIDEISYAIDEMKERNGERWTVKQMESQKKKLEEQLKSLSDESRKDDLITFEELGVDSIMVDEAHNFKNLAIFSKMNNVSGISSSGAKKSTDMQLKCQYLSEINDGRGIVFATGTPISNTMCEMYVMQLYLQKAALEEMGIYHFDSWAANFGEVTTALELTVEGSGFRFKSRFNKFTNLPELMNIFREVADVQTADMLDLDVPALRGGKPIIVESEPDWYVKQVMEDFVVRAERIRGGGVDPSVDNFLKITHEARLLGTDARLIDKDAPNNPDGKLNKVAENVWKEYEKGNANGHIGCQLIFSDIGTPGPDKDFTIYDYLKETLIQYGIPADEIAFIHDAKTDAQRDALFKEMRTGKKKVLIGSTDKCGTGVNVQTHLVAMHHVDCPWKPSSIEQREGRGISLGGANDLARTIAAVCGAVPVITTATDAHGIFAADEWAKHQNCIVLEPERIKLVSGKLLAGQPVYYWADIPVTGTVPAGLFPAEAPEKADLALTLCPTGQALHLVPRIGVLGIGCKRGTSAEALEAAFAAFCARHGLAVQAVTAAASIDLKQNEPGLLAFCQAHSWPVRFYSAAQLRSAPGQFTPSPFVQSVTGVDNVCERAAVLDAGGSLFYPKFACSGVTFALACRPFAPDWRWQND